MKYINTIIIAVVLMVAVLLSYVSAQKWMKNSAIDGCMMAGRAQFKNEGGQNVQVPDYWWLEFCMKQKGMKLVK